MKNTALKNNFFQSEKRLIEVCLSGDGKKVVCLFENGQGFRMQRDKLPFDDGSPITSVEIFDHNQAVAIHQASGNSYDLPGDSIKHYARGGRQHISSFGSVIKILRKKAKLTQGRLAWRCGISRVQVARIEGNKSTPGLETLEKIARAFDMSLPELVAL